MNKILIVFVALAFSTLTFGQSSMRRCTLLPVTDSVGGAIGFKVFEELERDLKTSDWCSYISNASMINVFSRYRDNLPQHLKNPEVLKTVGDRLKVGSIIRVTLVSELRGVELELSVHGENGEDLYFQEKMSISSDDINAITSRIQNWLDTYSKTIPYDAAVTGILGDQLTMDVAKNYNIRPGQKFVVKRLVAKKKHPLLKKIVDWQTTTLAEGVVMSYSNTQALGIVKNYASEQKLKQGDWVRLLDQVDEIPEEKLDDRPQDLNPGTLGILSANLFITSSSVSANASGSSQRWEGNIFGIDLRAEGWITRQYFAAIELMRSFGGLERESGSTGKKKIDATNGSFKLTGGYKYLPIGFFFGPQVDIYAGYARHSFGLTTDEASGLGDGDNVFSGIIFGFGANVPINREYKFFTRAEFIPFAGFESDSKIYSSTSNVSSLELELGVRYQMTVRMTLDAGFELRSNRAKFKENVKEVSYRDNLFKFGTSYNF